MPHEPIKKGDLVMVVRGHECVLAVRGGIPYPVESIVPQTGGGWRCTRCGRDGLASDALVGAHFAWHSNPNAGIPLGWLLKINPPADSLDTETNRELSHAE